MTLIPLISTTLSSRRSRAALAGGELRARGGYNPGAGHRPVAAGLAIGLPAALVVAVALSPMIIEKQPVTDSPVWRPIELEKPKPPEPTPEPQQRQQQPQDSVTTVPTPLPPITRDAPVFVSDPPHAPPLGTGSGPVTVIDPPPPPPPKLVLAQLDQRFLAGFQPDYPLREQREGVEGVARVRVLIGTDGRVKAVALISTDSPGFFEATKRRALAKWRFKPATRGGAPEESWKEMSVRFEIKNA